MNDLVCVTLKIIEYIAGWSSLVARWAHNPKVVGSNPAPATKFQLRLKIKKPSSEGFFVSAANHHRQSSEPSDSMVMSCVNPASVALNL